MHPHANITDLDETIRLYGELLCLKEQQPRDYHGLSSAFDALLDQCLDAYLYDLDSVNPDNMLTMFKRARNAGQHGCYPLPLTRHALESETAGMIPVLIAKMLLCSHRFIPYVHCQGHLPVSWARFVRAYLGVISEACDRIYYERQNPVDASRRYAKVTQ
jgi:hypothetical protein